MILQEFELPDGSSICFEILETSHFAESQKRYTVDPASPNIIKKAGKKLFKDVLNNMKSFTDALLLKLKDIKPSPDELEIEFGIKAVGETDIVIAAVSSEANLTIKMLWKKS